MATKMHLLSYLELIEIKKWAKRMQNEDLRYNKPGTPEVQHTLIEIMVKIDGTIMDKLSADSKQEISNG